MSGLYIHIPFCVRKCGYCDFYSVRASKDSELVQHFIDNLLTEISFKSYLFKNEIVDTVYFGGGTPSFISFSYIERIFSCLTKYYNLNSDLECTIEINPEHATDEFFRQMRSAGFINRLSTGFQAMDDQGLKYLGRNHSVSDNYRYLDLCSKYGFNNFSVDYIFGYETLDNKEIERSFKIFSDYNIPHISAYSLGIEENTPFAKKLASGIIHRPDDDFFLQQFKLVHNLLESFGYQHYEISNYSLPGMYSRHNSNYWDFVQYLGFGPSAHSFYNNSRSWNARKLVDYSNQISEKQLYTENEILNLDDNFNEFVMLKFRTFKGVDISCLKSRFPKYFDHFMKILHRKDLIDYFDFNDDYVKLTLDGIFISDYIISEFFV